jgi:hypothetical protein
VSAVLGSLGDPLRIVVTLAAEIRSGSPEVAPARESAPVTDLGERLFWTAVCALILIGIIALMWRGWRRRIARQGDLPPLPALPPALAAPTTEAEVLYVVTTTAGDWLDRIAARGLGVRSRAALEVYRTGVLIDRDGAPAVWIPAGRVRGARLDRGMAGKFTEEGGLVVVTWAHGDRVLDTGMRAIERDRHGELVAAISALADAADGSGEGPDVQHHPVRPGVAQDPSRGGTR